MIPEFAMDQNNLPEGIGYGVGGTAVLVWLATQMKALFRRDKVEDAEAQADEARAKAAASTFQGANEFLTMARVSNAQLIRTIEEMRKEHGAQIQSLQEQIEAMRRSHSQELAKIELYVIRLGGDLRTFKGSQSGSFQ